MRNKTVAISIIFCFFLLNAQAQHKVVPESEETLDSLSAHRKVSNDSLLLAVNTDTVHLAGLQFEQDFKEKYIGNNEFNYERTYGGRNLWDKIKEFINNLLRNLLGLDKLKKINLYSDYIIKGVFVLIFLAVGYIIVRLIMNHKGRWFFEKENKTVVEINYDNVEQHIHEADFESMIRQTELAGNTRQSIRLYYLWLLKTLTQKEIIVWNAEKTNADYTREIANEIVKKEFGYLSYLYNYIWYGEFSINDSEYENARQAFLNQIKPNGR